MNCLLLALGLALPCGVQDAHIPQTVEDLDIRKLKVPPQVAGTWHPVAMVASNVLLLDAESSPLERPPREYHGERKISVLDTDYSSYMTFCMEGPTHTNEGSVMCQCLGTWGPCRACSEELCLTEMGPLVEL
ncbi:hypothetical protein R6Z07F_003705 [Ovis aries]